MGETSNPHAIVLVFIGGNQSIRLQQQEAEQMINYLKSHSTDLNNKFDLLDRLCATS